MKTMMTATEKTTAEFLKKMGGGVVNENLFQIINTHEGLHPTKISPL